MTIDLPPSLGVETDWIMSLLEGLEKRIGVLPERAMRHTVLVEFIDTLLPEELVGVLIVLHHRAASGRKRSRDLLNEFALEPQALLQLPTETRDAAYELALEHGQERVLALFLGDKPMRNPTVDEAFVGNEHCDLPLGVRRQAARGRDRFLLDRLLHDRDYRVIALLLDNPRIIERDVVAIAARRPTRPDVLSVIAKHKKWASRYHVRRALCCNPYTPTPISHRLLPTLLRPDITTLYDQGVLPSKLRHVAALLLDKEPTWNKEQGVHPSVLEFPTASEREDPEAL